MTESFELIVETGPQAGARYAVPGGGLRLGRSSTCEIAIADPSLSRNHCLFEVRDGGLYVTDLASANGTVADGHELGVEAFRLSPGSLVAAGEVVVRVTMPSASSTETQVPPLKVDLGFDRPASSEEPAEEPSRTNPMRVLMWIAAVAAFGAAIWIVFSPDEAESGRRESTVRMSTEHKAGTGVLMSFAFERVEADEKGIHRTAFTVNADRELSAEVDFTDENRHVRKTKRLSDEAFARLTALATAVELQGLDADYTGTPLKMCELKSTWFRAVTPGRVLETHVENAAEPEIVRTFRADLEAFAEGELGIVAIRYAKDDLIRMANEARASADAKWEERDVAPGNLYRSITLYRQAVEDLKTVEPKPVDYEGLRAKLAEAEAELAKRFEDQRFVAYRAINLGDWETARRELRTLCDVVPDPSDVRNREATAKLLDAESRLKKGGRQ